MAIPMDVIKVKFPFEIEGVTSEIEMRTNIETKENLVSFVLMYDMPIEIDDGELKSKEERNGNFVYVYKFNDINGAIRFMNNRCVKVNYSPTLLDVEKVEAEMNAFMERYESGERTLRKKRKTIVVGEDGFMKYV
ncbi:hypothetical protein HK407_10g15530 [Ordospora pajunii]|uniref:uncharacterized protein n=1 Tax=Ordospora pajunii TaxID=3039483 RepID=UPI00295281E4|nr:uncharacterized protein HK407_10g15530 [Ordospora pajunii]KAH9410787.1 hypothetical protein HK407_10g15530 [Ordospora pajunii]